MQKIIIKLNEEQIKKDNLDIIELWEIIDKEFRKMQGVKEIRSDGSVSYIVNADRKSDFHLARHKLENHKKISKYVISWESVESENYYIKDEKKHIKEKDKSDIKKKGNMPVNEYIVLFGDNDITDDKNDIKKSEKE